MTNRIVLREFRTPLPGTGLEVYLRNKRPEGLSHFGPEMTLLFVHGATYPASVVFDLAVDGASWMDVIVARGFDVWLLDLPGYGRSSRPKQMDAPAGTGEPVITTETAVASVGAAVDFIRKECAIDALNLMGWSWGTRSWPATRSPIRSMCGNSRCSRRCG